MRRILKFRLKPIITQVETADQPTWLAVGAQGKDIVAWCQATPGEGHTDTLAGVMTGQAPPDDGDYIGTAEQSEGIVVHVYRQTA